MLDDPQPIVSNYYAAICGVSAAPVKVVDRQQELEMRGWREWLMTLCPFRFEEEFSADHVKFWDLHWSVLMRIKQQQKYLAVGLPIPEQYAIKDKEYVVLLI